MLTDVGVVAIGRNEGERLAACLRSLVGRVGVVVYVDSASTDGSVDRARQLGAEVVELDMSRPFTAARARNAGYERLRALQADVRFVQFVDGDCVVVDGWLQIARQRLLERSELAVVCGRRRELRPTDTIWNRIIDIEWDTPVGDALACGGDAMMRTEAFDAVGGFDGSVIAGEEPELCVRLRRAGWKIERLDAEMTLHDAAMKHARQWWTRAVRAGHAYAEGAAMHGDAPERHWVKEARRVWLWAGALPATAVLAAPPTLGLSLGLFLAYPLQAARIYAHTRSRGIPPTDAAAYATAVTVGRFAELQGALRYRRNRRRGQRSKIIEYK